MTRKQKAYLGNCAFLRNGIVHHPVSGHKSSFNTLTSLGEIKCNLTIKRTRGPSVWDSTSRSMAEHGVSLTGINELRRGFDSVSRRALKLLE